MRRRIGRRPSADDEDLDEDPDDDEEPSGPPRDRRGRHARPSVRPWTPGGDGDEDLDEEESPGGVFGFLHRPKRPVYFRARDSVYFEPLVALAILVLLFVSLWAYTQNWPPVYVIESDSMQHGSSDNLGLINTGDLVLAEKVDSVPITSYADGVRSGYTTYGEYGDVLLYYPDGVAGTPVIHRAILYLEASGTNTFDAPSLVGLPCGSAPNSFYSAGSTASGCGSTGLNGVLTLHGVGWQSVDVTINLDSLPRTNGFITMGDNNYLPGTPSGTGLTDQGVGISALVEPGWILVGVARGMAPWVGALKLLISGGTSEVPMQSWEFLGLSFVGVVLVAMGLHYLLRAEGIEDPRRKLEEEEEAAEDEDDEEEDEAPPSGRGRWLHPVRTWRGTDDDDEKGSPEGQRGGRTSRRHHTPPWGGRPKPLVGRKPATKGRKRSGSSDDEL